MRPDKEPMLRMSDLGFPRPAERAINEGRTTRVSSRVARTFCRQCRQSDVYSRPGEWSASRPPWFQRTRLASRVWILHCSLSHQRPYSFGPFHNILTKNSDIQLLGEALDLREDSSTSFWA